MSTPTPGRGERLDQIHTRWSLLRLAHDDAISQAGPARETLVLRYAGAVRGYVGAMLRDSQDADELSQEVVVKLLRGDFAGADPERGRFRDLLKVAVRNQVRTFETKKQRRSGKDLDLNQFADEAPSDPAWDETWRSTVLANTWASLEQYQRTHRGSVAHTILKLRVDFPEDDSPQLAERLAKATSKPFNAASMRQQLHRARLRFAEMLLEEVSRLVTNPTPERVQEELVAIGLMDYVKDFLPADWSKTGELSEAEG
jgi:DNA-directed RNA polymerase specialized sigma24 family protein